MPDDCFKMPDELFKMPDSSSIVHGYYHFRLFSIKSTPIYFQSELKEQRRPEYHPLTGAAWRKVHALIPRLPADNPAISPIDHVSN